MEQAHGRAASRAAGRARAMALVLTSPAAAVLAEHHHDFKSTQPKQADGVAAGMAPDRPRQEPLVSWRNAVHGAIALRCAIFDDRYGVSRYVMLPLSMEYGLDVLSLQAYWRTIDRH